VRVASVLLAVGVVIAVGFLVLLIVATAIGVSEGA
jgi:hypothetical protein